MISSRRLAREWALKILYQMDVGKVSLQEAKDTAMERLRMEFVQRGSRTASGSAAEHTFLNYVTQSLVETLPATRPAFQRAILLSLARAISGIPYTQEMYFEKSFRNKIKGVKLEPARLLSPASEVPVYGKDAAAAEVLTPAEKQQLAHFMREIVEMLPKLVEKELRKTGRACVAAIYQARQEGDFSDDTVLHHRREMNDTSEDRWLKVSQMVEKQTGEWMQVAGFSTRLILCIAENQKEIDTVLEGLSSGWKLDRQVAVDRNIMRLAAMELLYLPEIPASATINEAVELAKKFSTSESGRFVNGVLGGIESHLGSKAAVPAAPDEVEEEALIDDLDDLEELADSAELLMDGLDADSTDDPEDEDEED